jgi:hypothetical protein
MNETEKLRILIPHWIEHNEQHADEYRCWVQRAGEAKPDLLAALQAVAQVNAALSTALEKLGGPLLNHDDPHEGES